MLIDSQGPHSGKAFRLRDPSLGFGLDRGPSGVPGDAEMTGQRRDGGVVMAECIGGPPDRPYRQHRPRRHDRMLLGERRRGTTRLEAPPDSGQPTHHRHSAQAGRVVQHSAAAAVPDRSRALSDPTRRSALAVADHRLALRSHACRERRTSHRPGHTSAHPNHTYSGSPSGPSSDSLVASDPEGLDALTT